MISTLDSLSRFPVGSSASRMAGSVTSARAIVTDPDMLLADEPTGNLDAASARDLLTLLQKLNKDFGKTIVMVTHDPHSAAAASRLIHLDKGKFVEATDAVAAVA